MSAAGLTCSPAASVIESFQSSFVSGGQGSILDPPTVQRPHQDVLCDLCQPTPGKWSNCGISVAAVFSLITNTGFICVLI